VAPVISYSSLDEAVALASASHYGLSLGILSNDGLRALELASAFPRERFTSTTRPSATKRSFFRWQGHSGNGSRMGGLANLDAYTETQWVTAQSELRRTPSRNCSGQRITSQHGRGLAGVDRLA